MNLVLKLANTPSQRVGCSQSWFPRWLPSSWTIPGALPLPPGHHRSSSVPLCRWGGGTVERRLLRRSLCLFHNSVPGSGVDSRGNTAHIFVLVLIVQPWWGRTVCSAEWAVSWNPLIKAIFLTKRVTPPLRATSHLRFYAFRMGGGFSSDLTPPTCMAGIQVQFPLFTVNCNSTQRAFYGNL